MSRTPPPTSSGPNEQADIRPGLPGHDLRGPNSLEKELKVGSFEKSLTVNDLRAIQEALNHKKQSLPSSVSSASSGRQVPLSTHNAQFDQHHDNPESEKSNLMSEEDYSRTDSDGDSDDDEFFECNDDITLSSSPSAAQQPNIQNTTELSFAYLHTFFNDTARKSAAPQEFQAILTISKGSFTVTNNKSSCKLLWNGIHVITATKIFDVSRFQSSARKEFYNSYFRRLSWRRRK